jgi:hypothetical protein
LNIISIAFLFVLNLVRASAKSLTSTSILCRFLPIKRVGMYSLVHIR